MTSFAFLEILSSLFLQSCVLLCVCEWLLKHQDDPIVKDRMWAVAHRLILLLTVVNFLFPHLRWIVLPALAPVRWQPVLLLGTGWLGWCLTIVWLSGCFVYACLLVGGLVRGAALVRESSLLPEEWREKLGPLPGEIRLRVSFRVASPFLWQFHRPTIVLPSTVLDFHADEVQAILRHELAHFRAGHPLQLFVQRLVETLYWYHPLVWRASKSTAASRELRCDREAVSSPEEAQSYLNSLIRLMESQRPARTTLPCGLDFLGNSDLLRNRTATLLRRFAPEHTEGTAPRTCRQPVLVLIGMAIVLETLLWLPVNPLASQRSCWSPWPVWTAESMDTLGVHVRDYEVDGHRLTAHD